MLFRSVEYEIEEESIELKEKDIEEHKKEVRKDLRNFYEKMQNEDPNFNVVINGKNSTKIPLVPAKKQVKGNKRPEQAI